MKDVCPQTRKDANKTLETGQIETSDDTESESIFSCKGLSFVNLNIVTLPGKFDELRYFMNENPISIMTLNETRLDESIPDEEIHIQGYEILRKDRHRMGGGIAVYLDKNSGFTYKLRTDLMPAELEMIVFEVLCSKSKPFIVICWYRPETEIKMFDHFQSVLEKVEVENKDVIVIGDVNCDLLTDNPSCYTKKLKEITDSFDMTQLIKEATRVTENSESLIDHIYTTCPDKVIKSGVLHTGMSDHSFVYTVIGKERHTSVNGHKYSVNRNYKHFDDVAFMSDMCKVNWCTITTHINIDNAVNDFENKFAEVANRHAPLRKKRVRHTLSPWLTDDIVKTMRDRDDVKKRASIAKSPQLWDEYRNLRNKVNSMIKQSKKNFISDEIQSKDPKKIWKGLKHIVPGKTKDCNVKSIMTETGEKTGSYDVANEMNDYFANIGPNLAKKISDDNVCNDFYYVHNNVDNRNKFDFNLVTENYVLEQIQSLSNNKATGVDNMCVKLLKLSSCVIVAPLTYLINVSLESGIFPTNWKSARICPIFKGGNNSEACNYRPISILPILSKIIERAVFDQLYPHIDSHSMLHDAQSGFRPHFSTASALINVTDDWLNAIDKGHYVGIVLLDLQKAFDTVNHAVLIRKLYNYGMSTSVIKWFESYLYDRRHITIINGIKSNERQVTCGIPQGSILGPLLFILYINDLPKHVSNVKVSMYADDTALYYNSNDINDIVVKMNRDLKNVRKWLVRNKLSLNVKKTEFMIVGSNHKLSRIANVDINIHIDGEKIQRVNECKHLGVIIDDKLTWSKHITHVTKKIAPGLFYLRKSKNVIPSNMQSLLYNALIAPHFNYCNVVWGNCNKTLQNKLQVLQNRAAKIIKGVDRYTSSTETLNDLQWNNLSIKQYHNEAIMMYKAVNNLLPTYICSRFKEKEVQYNLRNNNVLVIDKPNTEYKKRSFTYRGASLWNTLNDNVKSAINLASFKKQLQSITV